MTLNLNEFLATVYADLFDFPLTSKEAKFWQIQDSRRLTEENHKYASLVEKGGNYLFLKNRRKLIYLREQREQLSAKKIALIGPILQSMKRIPAVQAVFLTGSLALGNARQNSDIDLMVVTLPGTMWLTRILVVAILKIKRQYRDSKKIANRICTNIFLDTNHLKSIDKNLYTAHEVLQVRCLYDRGGVEEKWLMENDWTEEFLPKAYSGRRIVFNGSRKAAHNFLSIFRYLTIPFELIAFVCQLLYMKPKMTKEKVSWGYAYFHPRDLSSSVVKAYQKRLRMVGIMDW